MEQTFVKLTDKDGGTVEEPVIPRERAERIIEEQEPYDVAHLAYWEAFPNMAANIVGTAILDLKTGEVRGSCYVEGHRDDSGFDHEIILCEYDAETCFRNESGSGYDYSAVLTEDEAREFAASVETGDRGDSSRVMFADVVVYLRGKGESLEDREERALAERLVKSNWPRWEDLVRQLNRVYAADAGV